MKRRRKEIGVYNILGMGKHHIARMMSLETLFIAIGCLSVGIGAGIVFSKLMYMVFLKLLGFPISFTLSISVVSIGVTLLLFAGIFIGTMILNLAHIHLSNPIELVTGTAAGEREPKTKWLMTLIGVLALGAGYWIALTVKTPLEAMMLFFVAVIFGYDRHLCFIYNGKHCPVKISESKQKVLLSNEKFHSGVWNALSHEAKRCRISQYLYFKHHGHYFSDNYYFYVCWTR